MPARLHLFVVAAFTVLAALFGCSSPIAPEVGANMDLIRRFIEETDAQNWDAYDDLLSPNLVLHLPGDVSLDKMQAIESEKIFAVGFPDASRSIEQLFTEGNKVALRERFTGTHNGVFMGVPATGGQMEITANAIYRIEDGKMAEVWVEFDLGVIMRQIQPATY